MPARCRRLTLTSSFQVIVGQVQRASRPGIPNPRPQTGFHGYEALSTEDQGVNLIITFTALVQGISGWKYLFCSVSNQEKQQKEKYKFRVIMQEFAGTVSVRREKIYRVIVGSWVFHQKESTVSTLGTYLGPRVLRLCRAPSAAGLSLGPLFKQSIFILSQ